MTDILVPAACMALVGVFLAAVALPILTRKDTWQRATGSRRQHLELTERKEQLYASIKELEFDRSLGKMSQIDYDAVRGGLEAEAVEILRRLDELGSDGSDDPAGGGHDSADLESQIEKDIAALRQAEPAAVSPTLAPTGQAKAHAFCHSCGQARTSEHRFCPHCGQRFVPTAS
jgi:hypothetical protein